MEFLDPNLVASKKFRRRKEEMTQEEFNEYGKISSKTDYAILREEPKICKIIKKLNNNDLDVSEYPYIDKPRPVKKNLNLQKKKGASSGNSSEFYKQDIIQNPRIFVFVYGGLSHHEVSAISNL